MVVKTLHHFAYLYVEVDQTDEDSKIEKYLTKAVNFLVSAGFIPQIGWRVNFEGNAYKIYKIEYTEIRKYHGAYAEECFPLVEYQFEDDT